MSSRIHHHARRWTLILGLAVLLFGVGFPLLQPVILPAASSLGSSILWIFIIPPTLIVGSLGIALGFYRREKEAVDGLRALYLSIGGLYLLLLLGPLSNLLWSFLVAPSAKIVVPNDFRGRFSIVIEDFEEPSLSTIGRKYTYEIPDSGEMQVERGWVAVRFAYEDGYNISGGRYRVQIVRRNGDLLKHSEFDCDYIYQPTVKGMTCNVQDDQRF